MLLLYTQRSPYARKVRMIALEKQISLELVDEDLQEKSARLLQANPLGKVPTLILDDGTCVFDSSVIVAYLDGLKDCPLMIPSASKERLAVLKWQAFADDLITTAINLYMEKVRHPQDFNQCFVTTLEENIQRAYGHITQHFDTFKDFNLAPIAVASAIGYIDFRLPHLKAQGVLRAWFEQVSKRPSMIATLPCA